jgi:hypothetical protein
MPRNISFFLTKDQIVNQTKTVTRRAGWLFLKVGDILNACEKCQGVGKGNKVVKICQIKVTNIRRESLADITSEDVILEGFPKMTKKEFILFYSKHNKYRISDLVTRIEFEYLD